MFYNRIYQRYEPIEHHSRDSGILPLKYNQDEKHIDSMATQIAMRLLLVQSLSSFFCHISRSLSRYRVLLLHNRFVTYTKGYGIYVTL